MGIHLATQFVFDSSFESSLLIPRKPQPVHKFFEVFGGIGFSYEDINKEKHPLRTVILAVAKLYDMKQLAHDSGSGSLAVESFEATIFLVRQAYLGALYEYVPPSHMKIYETTYRLQGINTISLNDYQQNMHHNMVMFKFGSDPISYKSFDEFIGMPIGSVSADDLTLDPPPEQVIERE